MIKSMSVDEQIDLVALTWLGRGDGGVEDWSELRAEAARAHNRHTAGYLLGIPLLAGGTIDWPNCITEHRPDWDRIRERYASRA